MFSSAPIFIGGDGRSGTTLLSVILDSHPNLAVGPELHFNGRKLLNLGPYVLECLKLIAEKDPRVTGNGLQEQYKPGVQFIRRCQRAGVKLEELYRLIIEQMEATNSELTNFEERCSLVNAIGELNCRRYSKQRWGIKIMREIRNISKYAQVWPSAQFIHIIRDGRDVAASQMMEHGSWGYENIEKAAIGWVRLIEESRENGKNLPLLEIKYEDLVLQPEKTLNTVLDFLGESWHDDLLRHHEKSHSVIESSIRHPSKDAVARPIYTSAIGRYRRDLTPYDIHKFNKIAGKYLSELGYDIKS